MRCLLVYKKSLYHFYAGKKDMQKKIKKDKDFCSCITKNNDSLIKSMETVEKVLKKHNIDYKKVYRAQIKKPFNADLIICVGGDGTLLNVAHHLQRGDLLLVNAVPEQSVAFYSGCTAKQFEKTLKQYLKGKLRQLHLNRLSLKINGKQLPEKPLNDILLAHENPASVTRYILHVNGKKEEQKSSGIWISTPGGSTAAILNAGGKPMTLEKKNIQYLVREPERSLKLKKGIVKKLKVKSRTRRCKLYLDGAHIRYDLGLLDELEVSMAKQKLCLLGRDEILRRKKIFERKL